MYVCGFLQAAGEINPSLFTVATLTGHVIIAYGSNYSVRILSLLLAGFSYEIFHFNSMENTAGYNYIF